MQKETTIRASIAIYFKKKLREAIQHILTGIGSSLFIVHVAHLLEFTKQNNFLAIILTIFIGLIPVAIDFIAFHRKNKKHFHGRLNNLENVLDKFTQADKENLNKLVLHYIDTQIGLIDKLSHGQSAPIETVKKVLDIITQMEHNCINGILVNYNEQKINSSILRLWKTNDMINKILEGQMTIDSLQNYEYVRNIFLRILDSTMKRGDFYIALSSLGFWTKKPFLENNNTNGRSVFIKKNIDEIGHGKFIKRIIVIDRRLLLETDTISKLNIPDEEKGRILEDRAALKLLVNELNTSDFNNYTNYNQALLTVFCCIDNQELKNCQEHLATAFVVTANYKNLMLIKTKDLTSYPDKNAAVNIVYCSLKEDLKINEKASFDPKKIISEILDKPDNLVYPTSINNQERLIDVENFMINYKKYYDKISYGSNYLIENNDQIRTISELHKILNN